ncbi:IS3 family transposase [Pseudonocardia oroxyli]|uniref:Putative transposase n=1 Tax=Pseudonocardia oroxyli TaxID=366584 RepID=A0A1G8EEG4_PSEOR|nr:putative transposase [Pseudonocardia oroxyli]
MIVAYIDAHKVRFGVEPICAVLRAEGIAVAPSGYYAHKNRRLSRRALTDAALAEIIEATFFDRDKGRGVYGARKMWHQLRRDRVTSPAGRPVARCTVERLMRRLGLHGVRRGQPLITTRPDRQADRAPDLVDRDFTAARPNQLWVVDMTYVPTWSGTVFTAFVSDVYSRRVVGWRCASRMPTELPLDALEMALWTREHAGQTTDGRLDGLIHHSDAGSQYTAIRYGNRLAEAGAVASIGSVGDSYDCETGVRRPVGLTHAYDWPSRCPGVDLSAARATPPLVAHRAGSDLIGA